MAPVLRRNREHTDSAAGGAWYDFLDPSGIAMEEHEVKPLPPEIVQFLNTEHFTLQAARSQTISESNGRFGGYLTLLSSTIVALAFISQISGSEEILLMVSLVLLPMDIFLGVVTITRIAQLATVNIVSLAGMNRIRGYYVDAAPELQRYLVMPHADDDDSMRKGMFIPKGFGENFSSVSAVIGVLNSILAGALLGIISFTWLGMTPAASFIAAMIALALSMLVHAIAGLRYARKLLKNSDLNLEFLDR